MISATIKRARAIIELYKSMVETDSFLVTIYSMICIREYYKLPKSDKLSEYIHARAKNALLSEDCEPS